MKRTIMIALAFALMAGSALAQQGSGTGPGDGTGAGLGDGTHPAPADGTGFGPGMGGSGPGYGPGGMGNCQNPDGGAQFAERLGLDEVQAGQVAALMGDARLQHEAIREAARGEYCAVRAGVEAELATILDAEQFEEWLNMRNHQERRRGFRGQFGPFDPAFDCAVDEGADG